MKIIITRSYSEKWNMGNYQTSDFSATRSIEYDPSDQVIDLPKKISEKLFKECWDEVKESIAQAKFQQAKEKGLTSAKVGEKAREEAKFVAESDIQSLSEE